MMSFCTPLVSMVRGIAISAVFGMVVIVGGCAGKDRPSTAATFRLEFSDLVPYRFAAMGPEIVSTFVAPRDANHVEDFMPVTLEQGATLWAQERFRTSGVGRDRIRVEIREASVTEKTLPISGGVVGFFTNEADLRYEGRLVVALQLVGDTNALRAEIVASAWRTKEMLQKASLAERDQLWFDLVGQLIRDIDDQFSSSVHDVFKQWMVL